MEELKPCPFCGTPPSLELEMRYPNTHGEREFGVIWEVICPYCGTTKRSSGITKYVVGIEGNLIRCKDSTDGRAKAIANWNNRAQTKAVTPHGAICSSKEEK